jgi:NADPH:quinone reductase-like Zn-dependent oxidoreductase
MTMRAVVHDRYGAPDVLRLVETDRPVPEPEEVLVEVRAATVNRTDTGFRQGKPFIARFFSGLLTPRYRVLGNEFAGVVVAAGAGVTKFAVGDRVFGVNPKFGTHAEFTRISQDAAIAAIPAAVSFEVAAAVCDGIVLAKNVLDAFDVHAGERVLVYGASGSIGTAGVQLAKLLGAQVTAVCDSSTIETVRSLGPDEVIDYTTDDFTRNGVQYDYVFDAVGKHSFGRCKASMPPHGIFISTDLGFLWQNPLLALGTKFVGSRNVKFPIPKYSQETAEWAATLLAACEYTAVIDRTYPLDEIVEAHRYVDSQRKTGNVVITVAG